MDLAINLVVSAVSLVLGAVLGVMLGESVKRPRLRQSGSGGGMAGTSVSFTNDPGFVGLSIGQTVLLGRAVHRECRLGVPVDRNPTDCHAVLLDPENPRGGVGLLMRDEDIPDRPVGRARVKTGGSVQVLLFVRVPGGGKEFYLFEPDPSNPWQPRPPDPSKILTAPKKFLLRVYYGGNRSTEVPVSVTVGLNGQMALETPNSSVGM